MNDSFRYLVTTTALVAGLFAGVYVGSGHATPAAPITGLIDQPAAPTVDAPLGAALQAVAGDTYEVIYNPASRDYVVEHYAGQRANRLLGAALQAVAGDTYEVVYVPDTGDYVVAPVC